MPRDWPCLLGQQYEALGGPTAFGSDYKSHWVGCDRGNPLRMVELPAEAPVDLITCNARWRRRGHLYVLPCSPRVVGRPHDWRRCSRCDLRRHRLRDLGCGP